MSKPIETDEEYDAALKEIAELSRKDIKAGSPEHDHYEELHYLCDEYEDKLYPPSEPLPSPNVLLIGVVQALLDTSIVVLTVPFWIWGVPKMLLDKYRQRRERKKNPSRGTVRPTNSINW
jgi:hypothetical protein